jgi:hypothetical protein
MKLCACGCGKALTKKYSVTYASRACFQRHKIAHPKTFPPTQAPCTTCTDGHLTVGEVKRGVRRCRACRKANPGRPDVTGRLSSKRVTPMMRKARVAPATCCEQCAGELSHADKLTGCRRCKGCRAKAPGRVYGQRSSVGAIHPFTESIEAAKTNKKGKQSAVGYSWWTESRPEDFTATAVSVFAAAKEQGRIPVPLALNHDAFDQGAING